MSDTQSIFKCTLVKNNSDPSLAAEGEKGSVTKEPQTWRLISNGIYGVYENGKKLTYFDFREMEGDAEIYEFLALYVISLMDIAEKPDIDEEDEPYHVYLAKGDTANPPVDKFGSRPYGFIEKITPKEAREILNNIHDVINKFSDARAIPLAAANEKINSLTKLRVALRGSQEEKDIAAWAYFDHKRMIDDEDLGFNDSDLRNEETFINALNEIIAFVKYLRLKKKEDDEKNVKQSK